MQSRKRQFGRFSAIKRRQTGSQIAEAMPAIWIIIIGIGFPLFILATLTLRFALFWQAAKEAAHVSCQAQTFYTAPGFPASALSAVQAATATASQVLNAFPGCTLTQPVEVYIGTTPISGTLTSWSPAANTPLNPGDIDTDQNVYSIRVVLVGQVSPLIRMNIPFFGGVPGLSQPFPARVQEERVFENPTGLTQ